MSRLLSFSIMAIIGFVAQFIDGTLGMGYGAFSASLLITAGILPAIASATVHTAECFTTLFSGGSHLFFGNVKKEWLIPLVIPGVIGGAFGAYFLASLPGEEMRPYMAGILLALGIIVFYRFLRAKVPPNNNAGAPVANKEQKTSLRKLVPLGFTAAFVDAMGGGGWGPIATPGLILTEDIEPRKVVGTVNLAEFFITIAITITFIATIGLELFRWDLVVALLIGGLIAAPIAAYLCRRLPHRILGILVGVALIGFNLRTILTVIL